MSTNQIHSHIERLSNLLRTETRKLLLEQGLQPVQLEVIHYLSACNRYSNTVNGVAEYLGQTKGTVSQSIKVLEREGLITKHADIIDKRILHLKITSRSKALLKKTIPAPLFSNASKIIKDKSINQILNSLTYLLAAVQKANGLKSFGICHTCRHNQMLNNGKHLCGLTNEILSSKEIQLICREHDDGTQVLSV